MSIAVACVLFVYHETWTIMKIWELFRPTLLTLYELAKIEEELLKLAPDSPYRESCLKRRDGKRKEVEERTGNSVRSLIAKREELGRSAKEPLPMEWNKMKEGLEAKWDVVIKPPRVTESKEVMEEMKERWKTVKPYLDELMKGLGPKWNVHAALLIVLNGIHYPNGP